MKALTLYPEWLYAILYLNKRVENRPWKPRKSIAGKLIALHAGAYIGGVRMSKKSMMRGRRPLLDVVEYAISEKWTYEDHSGKDGEEYFLYDEGSSIIRHMHESTIVKGAIAGVARVDKITRSGGNPPPWGVGYQNHWHLSDVVVLTNPVPHGGKLGLWALPNSVTQSVAADLEQSMGREEARLLMKDA